MISREVGSHLFVATLLVALAIVPASAQTRGGKAPSKPSGGTSEPAGAILLYGQPGNCPPTMACGPKKPVPPVRSRHCVKWELTKTVSGQTIRRCLDP